MAGEITNRYVSMMNGGAPLDRDGAFALLESPARPAQRRAAERGADPTAWGIGSPSESESARSRVAPISFVRAGGRGGVAANALEARRSGTHPASDPGAAIGPTACK
jgi:hypothetical protein